MKLKYERQFHGKILLYNYTISNILELLMYFLLIKEMKLSNFYIININTFYLENLLNNPCRLSKIKEESSNLGPKLPYLCIFRLSFGKLLKYLKKLRIF